jgi:hypothetical protein
MTASTLGNREKTYPKKKSVWRIDKEPLQPLIKGFHNSTGREQTSQ